MKHRKTLLATLLVALSTPFLLSFSAAMTAAQSQQDATALEFEEPLVIDQDGTECVTGFSVTSLSTNDPASRIKVVAEYADGSTVPEILEPGESHSFNCNLTVVTIVETVVERSYVKVPSN